MLLVTISILQVKGMTVISSSYWIVVEIFSTHLYIGLQGAQTIPVVAHLRADRRGAPGTHLLRKVTDESRLSTDSKTSRNEVTIQLITFSNQFLQSSLLCLQHRLCGGQLNLHARQCFLQTNNVLSRSVKSYTLSSNTLISPFWFYCSRDAASDSQHPVCTSAAKQRSKGM